MKCQSAMEYLTTYGWAILIIAIVMAAMLSLGVFNPYTFAPKTTPGSCQVQRSGLGYTALTGICTNQIPQSVASFPTYTAAGNSGYVPIYINNIGQPTMSALTMTWWVKPIKANILLHLYTNEYANTPYCHVSSCNAPKNAIAQVEVYPPTAAKNNVWSFESLTLSSSGTAIMYLNGNPGTAITWGGPLTGITYLSIFGYMPTYGDWSNASMANVQVYNTSLSGADIKALYKEGIGGAPINLQNLVGWWPLNGNANDYSGNGNDGVATNVIFISNWETNYTSP